MNMDHLELRDDDSDGPGGNKDAFVHSNFPKLRTTGLRNSSTAQQNGELNNQLTRFSGYRGS